MKLITLIFILFLTLVNSDFNYYYSRFLRLLYKEDSLKYSLYPPLPNTIGYKPFPTVVKHKDYLWLARIVPVGVTSTLTLCTCACVSKKVFVSSARCVIGLTIGYVHVAYGDPEANSLSYLIVTAIIVPKPSEASKQYHEDAGLLVTEDNGLDIWNTVPLYQEKRTDNLFDWFVKTGLEQGPMIHKIIAIVDKNEHETTPVTIDVSVGVNFCQEIYTNNYSIPGFLAPCVYPCREGKGFGTSECNALIAKKGSAIYNSKDKYLFGVATWMGESENTNWYLPVGIAILNSQNFLNDYACALKIRDSSDPPPYQKLCGF